MYANGDERINKNFQFLAMLAFNAAYGAGSVGSLSSYKQYGSNAPFQIGAASAVFAFVVYTGYYLMRVGLPQSLKDFEERRADGKGRPAAASRLSTHDIKDCNGLKGLQTMEQLVVAKKA